MHGVCLIRLFINILALHANIKLHLKLIFYWCYAFSDHSYVQVGIEMGFSKRSRSKWQMDRCLLQDPVWLEEFRLWILDYFTNNEGTAQMFSVWGVFKAAACRQMIAASARKTRECLGQIAQFQQWLVYASKLVGSTSRAQLERARKALRDFFLVEEINSSQTYLQKVYEESQMVGKMLAWSTRARQESICIVEILDPKIKH